MRPSVIQRERRVKPTGHQLRHGPVRRFEGSENLELGHGNQLQVSPSGGAALTRMVNDSATRLMADSLS